MDTNPSSDELDAIFGFMSTVGGDQVLTFRLGEEEYGVDILRVQEIRGWSRVTPIPDTPEYIKGVMNLRGAIVPVIDLRQRFGLEPLPYGPTTGVVVVRVESGKRQRIMGMVVDAVSEVHPMKEEDLQPAPDLGGSVRVEFVRGLVTVGEAMVVVLDVDALLNSDALAIDAPLTGEDTAAAAEAAGSDKT